MLLWKMHEETAPHKICAYIYELANAFNSFYHGTKILAETDETLQKSYISILELTKSVLETCIDVLGFSAPNVCNLDKFHGICHKK